MKRLVLYADCAGSIDPVLVGDLVQLVWGFGPADGDTIGIGRVILIEDGQRLAIDAGRFGIWPIGDDSED